MEFLIFINTTFKTWKLKNSLEACFLITVRAVLKFLWHEQTVSHKRGQEHRLPDTYINKNYANFIKLIKITSNSTQNKQKAQKA